MGIVYMDTMQRKVKSNGRVKSSNHNTAMQRYVEAKGEDQVIVKDKAGFLTGGQPVDRRDQMMEAGNWEEKFEKFDKYAQEYDSLERAVEKAVDTGTYAIPIHVSDELVDSDEAKFPLAEALARVGVASDRVEIDEQTERGSASSFSEGGRVPENDDTVTRKEYNIVSYGRKNEVTDQIQLAASRLNPVNKEVENQTKAIREYEETQIHKGTVNGDASGFKGIDDFVPTDNVFDGTGSTEPGVSEVRDLLKALDQNNGSLGDILITVDTSSYHDMKSGLDDFVRYQSPGELNFGYQVFTIDGVPILKSSALNTTSGSREMYAVDASAHYMAELKGTTMEAMPRGSGESDVADVVHTHAFACLVSQHTARAAKYENLA